MSHSGHFHYHTLRLSEISRLYWANTIKLLATNMSIIFIPIYLYKIQYSLTEILVYFFLFSVFWLAIQYGVMKFSNRIGANRAMALSLFINGLHMILIATIEIFHWPLWLIALLWAVYVALYWPNFRACFAKSLLHKKVGPSVGMSAALSTLAYGVAPAIGGIVATVMGIGFLYAVATILFIVAAIPLIGGREIIKNDMFDLKRLSWRKIRRDLVANAGSEIDDDILSIVWPLFIFLIVPTYAGVGILSSISVIGGILIALYVGRREELKGTAKYLKNGSLAVTLSNGIRLFSQSAGQIAGVNFINGLGHALVATPYYSRYYTNAENEPLLPYIYAMMVASALGFMLLFGTLIILSLFAPIQIVLLVGLLFAVPAGFALRLIRT